MNARLFFMFFMILVLFAPRSSASTTEDVKRGNLLYNDNKYDEAQKAYEKALSKKEGSGIVNFNLGNTLYKKGFYDNSIASYNKALASGESRLIPQTDFNIGNAQYRIGGKKESTDISKTKELYETALKYYKRSIDLDPRDMDAKYNYELVEKKLESLTETYQMKKEEQEKDKQKQDKSNQDKEKQQKDKEEEQGMGGQKDKEEQKDRDKQKDGGGQAESEKKEEGKEREEEPKQAGGREPEKQDKSEGGKEPQEKKGPQGTEEKEADAEKKEEPGAEEKKEEVPEDKEEQAKKQKEEKGLEFYQTPEEPREMNEGEARMLLEGYKGEEATGKSVRLRRKPIQIDEPVKNW